MTVQSVASARLTDDRPQILAATGHGLFSTWKVSTHPDAAWSGWHPFEFLHGRVTSLAAASLTDGRPQILAATSSGEMWTTWKVDTHPDTAWADWAKFDGPPGSVRSVGAASLTDNRPQLFAGTDSGLFSTWKLSTHPDASWADWTRFDGLPGA